VGLRPEKTTPCSFPPKSRYGFRRARKIGRRGVVFCQVDDAPLLPLSFDRFPPNIPRTRVQVVARDTWFHITEKFTVRDQISRKTVFLGYVRVPCLCPAYGSQGNVLPRLGCFHALVDIPQIYPSWVTFAEGCTVFQLSTSERLPVPRYQQRRNVDGYICFKHTRQGAQQSDRRFALAHSTSAHFLV